MSTSVHGIHPYSSHEPHENSAGKLTLAALVLWAVIGPVISMIYEYRISVFDWEATAPSLLQQVDDAKVAYFTAAQQQFIAGCGIWIIGLVVLAIMYARNSIFRVSEK